MTGRLQGKVAVVTGGTSGIGLATARLFAAEGAQVLVTGRSHAAVGAAVDGVAHLDGVVADVTQMADLERLRDTIGTRHGRIDILFANAGIGPVAPIGAVEEGQFDLVFATNVKGVFYTVQTLLPLIADHASVILTGSIAGMKGVPAFSVYSATKAAVRSFARTWTTDLKDRHIRVNTIVPGPIETPVFGKMGMDADGIRQFKDGMATQIPAGRIGGVDDVARAALYLASDDSSFVTGAELVVDGGLSAV